MATFDASDCCLVCADPLEWAGVGSCGHKELCSRCVARMRFILKDKKCVLCKQENSLIYFTRFVGDYTVRFPDSLPAMQDGAKKGDLRYCAAVDGYFDDEKHYQEIKSLCGYTHPVLADEASAPKFTNQRDMKRYIETTYKMNFCDICMTSRKVFLCEQLLYNKVQLDRHNRQGDETGPLAESNFKGHPLCKFCRQRFYDSQELWRHMESAHEHCFLCRRSSPDKYVYYRHYKELEDHFRDDHHLCPHPNCMEKKFVVFQSEQELKRHFAAEHGDELKMSRAQRREALAVPVQLQYRSRDEVALQGQAAADAQQLAAIHERAGVVIGGGLGVTNQSRHGHSQRNNTNTMHASRSEPQLAAAVQASMDSAHLDVDSITSVTFSASDFPSVGAAYGTSSSSQPVTGLWTAAASSAGGPGSGSLTSADDFPALPTLSKAAKKRIKDSQASLAQRLTASAAPPRVINRAVTSGAPASSAADYPPLPSAPAPISSATYPALGTSSSNRNSRILEPSRSGMEAFTTPGSASSNVPPAPSAETSSRAAAALFFALDSGRPQGAASDQLPASLQAADIRPPTLDDFPALPVSSKGKGKGKGKQVPSSPPPTSDKARGSTAAAEAFKAAQERATSARANSLNMSGNLSSHQRPQSSSSSLSTQDFPSLGQISVTPSSTLPAPTPSGPTSSSPCNNSTGPADASAPQGGASETLKSANRVLIDIVRAKLNSDARFAQFKEHSGKFLKGILSAHEYHDLMVDLGLLQLVPEAAALCPILEKRSALREAHIRFLSSPDANDMRRLGDSWMPPEAAIAAAKQAEMKECWSCPLCTLSNAASVVACEACGTKCPLGQGACNGIEDFPSLASSSSSSRENVPQIKQQAEEGDVKEKVHGGKSGKGKGTILSIGLARQGGGRNHGQQVTTPKPAPNVWGQDNAAIKKRAEEERYRLLEQAASRGAWAQSGGSKLARKVGAINDAWGE
ncbi:hypothetical protein CEUSTIGMA_g2220.t1 [Chlamydomonas eustigma]|uniref:RING-type E3 ubiquitin transferase n=1 Tax=Chlamydomonas eustigma TaxID=1157962 RepID=A0A250WVA4_9CHLO|nr:hypothetical protein CEUSTIGMA_g2220.t1 [Chlamydomonas eustigma]|eukprot:GAX74773.1 hypothetical protein CEUSTIGMA_g2220.t1 [Chlamydomonas eustigma]